MNIIPTVTTAGLGAVLNSTNDGVAARITEIALGDEAYTPGADATALRSERSRIQVSGGNRINETQVHVTAVENTDTEYWVREIGFFFDDGTLFAIWSNPDQALAFKAAGVDLLLAFDLVLSALPEDSITVEGNGEVNLSPGTQTVLGVMRFATEDEALSGEVNNAAVSPSSMRAHGDNRYSQQGHAHNWSELQGRPSAFPPADHAHSWSELQNRPSTFPPADHAHNWSELQGRPSTFPPADHAHTWSELQGRPSTFPPADHAHNWNELQGRPSTYPPADHAHNWNELQGRPSTFPPADHAHNWNELQGRPLTFPPSDHGHPWNQITGRPTSYPPSAHDHAQYEVSNDFSVTNGRLRTQNRRGFPNYEGFNDFESNYADVFPPSGFTLGDLDGFIASPALILFDGDVGRDDHFWCIWEFRPTFIRVICANSENRANTSGTSSYINYLAVWRR